MKSKLLIINDNHCEIDQQTGKVFFKIATFHLFLKYFSRLQVTLSSPCLGYVKSLTELEIDGIRVASRPPYGIAAEFYRIAPFHLIRYYFHFLNLFKEFDSILLVMPASSAPAAWLAAKTLGKKVFCYLVGDVLEVISRPDSRDGFLKNRLSILAARWEEGFTRFLVRRCPTFALGSSLMEKYEEVACKIQPAMTSLIEASSISQPEFKDLDSPVKVVTVSRLSREKGLDIGLKTMSQLRDRGLDCVWSIAGEGPIRNELEKLIEELGLQDRVVFHGMVNDRRALDAIYDEADLFLLPSLSEGIPKVILEAMAASLSVIATNAGGIPDLIGKNGDCGWLIEPGSIESCVQAVEECIKNDKERNRKKTRAYEFILEHTGEKEASRIEDLIFDFEQKKC